MIRVGWVSKLDADRERSAWLAFALALAALGAVSPAVAQPEPQDDHDPFHWAYASTIGSGVYRLTDGTQARVFRVRPAVRVRQAETREGPNFGVRILLPIAAGIQDLDGDDLPAGREDDEIEMVAFLPGVEFEFPGERWALRVNAQYGYGKELEGAEEDAKLLELGVRSRLTWSGAAGKPTWIGGLTWLGFETGADLRRSLLRMTHGFEFDVPVPRWQFRGRSMHLYPHLLGDWYYRPPGWLDVGDGPSRHMDTEWQVGLAAGPADGFRIWFLEFDAVGVALRVAEHRTGVRFYLNSVF